MVASAGGVPTHHGWYHNLRDRPGVTVGVGNRTRTMREETTGPEERARLWTRITERYPYFAGYRARISG